MAAWANGAKVFPSSATTFSVKKGKWQLLGLFTRPAMVINAIRQKMQFSWKT